MKNKKTQSATIRFSPVLAILSAGLCASAPAAITMTDLTNVTLAASQVESGGDTSDNPEVTGGLGGPIIAYTETGSNGYDCCGGRVGTYGAHNLNDGDIGVSPTNQDGFYAIPTSGAGAVVISFTGGPTTIAGIAIYNGYANRDDGNYQLSDGLGNVLGGWSIATDAALLGGSNNGMDSFWLTFNSPVTTDRLVIDTAVGDCCGTPSFREIQVFGIPEPSVLSVMLVGFAGLLGIRRRSSRS